VAESEKKIPSENYFSLKQLVLDKKLNTVRRRTLSKLQSAGRENCYFYDSGRYMHTLMRVLLGCWQTDALDFDEPRRGC
jgi:hypothetical protein